MKNEATRRRLIWAAFGLAAGLRLLGIHWGLPHTYNSDEPHYIHMAVSFGGGSLKPYFFKYPTLWPYLLAACYGLYFLLWSGFGLARSVSDFVGLYAWHPTSFYLIGRLLSAAFSLLAAAVLWRAEQRRRPEGWPWAALLLLFAPLLVEAAHAAKADCLMIFFACVGWSAALEVHGAGGRRFHWLCGAAFGLAMSSQYTALPAVLALPLAHLCARRRQPLSWLIEGFAACAVGFFVGSPYTLLDFPRFWAALADLKAMPPSLSRSLMIQKVISNFWTFAAPGSIAGLAAATGLVRLWRHERGLAVVLGGPLLAYFVILSLSPDGGLGRYMFGGYPALALLAGEGLALVERQRRPLLSLLVAAAALGPGIGLSLVQDRAMRLPDTRAQAEAWVLSHIPAGTTILLDQPSSSPNLAMIKEQVWELEHLTRQAGSPRWRLYQGMAEHHPGGGYRLYRIQRSAQELGSAPQHTRISQAETPTVDITAGLDAARALRVNYVLTSSFGAESSPQFTKFFNQLYASARLIESFAPSPGKVAGPTIRIYELR